MRSRPRRLCPKSGRCPQAAFRGIQKPGRIVYTITVTTNLVLVPVTVTDNQGRLVGGLLAQRFFSSGKWAEADVEVFHQ